MRWLKPALLLALLLLIFSPSSRSEARPPTNIEIASVSTTGIAANGGSSHADMSHDGRYVAFHSHASNLSPEDSDNLIGVYLRDRLNETTIYIGTYETPSEWSPIPEIEVSGNGEWVAFSSYGRLVPEDTDNAEDVYLYNINTQVLHFVSEGIAGDAGNVSVSYEACTVVYDVNLYGVYMYDRVNGSTQVIGPAGLDPHISADGSFVTYAYSGSRALRLYDRNVGTSRQIDVRGAISPVISADGNWIVYETTQTSSHRQIAVYDRINDSKNIITNGNNDSYDPDLTANGSWIVFSSFASDLVPGPDTITGDIFAYERATGSIERISLRTDGGEPNNTTFIPKISGNGLYVLFHSAATDYVVPDPNANIGDTFVAEYGLVTSPILARVDSCTLQPDYDSTPIPDTTITLTGTPGTLQTAALDISNTGTAGSLLDVIQVNPLTNFTTTGLPITALTPSDGVTPITIQCTIPAPGNSYMETLTLQTNESTSPTYNYTLECLPNVGATVEFASADGGIIAETAGGYMADVILTVTGTGILPSPIAVNITLDGTATAGVDYTPTGPTIPVIFTNTGGFTAGTYTTSVALSILDDTDVEGSETVILTLNNPANLAVSLGSITSHWLTINDDEQPLPTQLLTSAACNIANLEITITAGDGPFNIMASAGINMPILDVGLGTTLILGPEKWDNLTVFETSGDLQSVNLGQFKCRTEERPIPLAPSHLSHITNPFPVFSWTAISSANNYRVFVFDDRVEANRTVDIRQNSGGTLTMTLTVPLPDGRLFWRVRGRQNRLWGYWSVRFTLFKDPASPLSILTPVPTIDIDGVPTMVPQPTIAPPPTRPAPPNAR